MKEYIDSLSRILPEKDNLKMVKREAAEFFKTHTAEQCCDAIEPLYGCDNFQIQEIGVLLCGYIGHSFPQAVVFLRDTVSNHSSWKVQEVLAMAFDLHCKMIGYENALPLIREWLGHNSPNVRRAVSEGLRIWTSRPYFKEHPDVAISLLTINHDDKSEYVRKSVGNALRDISKKHPALVLAELDRWDLSLKTVKQTYKLAKRWIEKQQKLGFNEVYPSI